MKRMIVFLLILAALLMLCCASALADTCQVWYKDFDEGGSQLSNKEATATVVTSTTTRFLQTGYYVDDSYYVAIGDVTFPGRISCTTGNLHLILCDGAKLHISKGIFVPEGCHLTITSGRTVEGNSMYGTGELIIDNVSGIYAGIGGCNLTNSGSITINGGRITVTGSQYCAAIGGGYKATGGSVTINGGRITATGGEDAAAIGGGQQATGGSVTINGGNVTAIGGENGAGIGCGTEASSGSVTINGGWITAIGSGQSPGIGAYPYEPALTVNGDSARQIVLYASSYRANYKVSGKFSTENAESLPGSPLYWAGQYVYNHLSPYPTVYYADANGADMGSARCMIVENYMTVWDDGSSSVGNGWYYLPTNRTINDRITVVGDVNLILRDGMTLTAEKGITVTESGSLTVWAQSGGTGTLYAGTNGTGVTCAAGSAGIGGGALTINGGVIRACGNGGAGIGGGTVTLNGGSITAAGGSGKPAIGGSILFADGMTVTAAGAPVPYDSRVSACAKNEVTVTRCGHEGMLVPTDEDGWGCQYCGHASGEAGIGCGTADAPWRIGSDGVWNTIAAAIENGFSTQGKYFTLTDNISVGTMMGTQDHKFSGVFDGNGKTLTFTLGDHPEIAAPFRYISNATIRNLHVTGRITGANKQAAGLIGENSGTSTINNCRVSAEISGSQLVGGFSIGTGKKLSITGCVFDGKITGEPNQSGCFVAWGTSGLTITDCMADPQNGTTFTGGTFCHEGSAPTLTNCYYTTAVATAQGKQAFSVKGDNGVTIDFGTPSATYSVSGITAYPTGLKYGSDSTFYAGEGDNVAMNPVADPWEGHATSFTASAGTMTVSGSGWTLTMSSDNTVISVLRTPTFATTPVMHLTFDSGTGGYNNQGPEKLFDGLDDTKWCTAFNANGWYVEFHTDVPIKPTAYSMTTGGDTKRYPGRNPYSWQLLGRRNTEDAWTSLTVESNNDHLPPENCVEVFFPLNTEGGYRYYRLEVTAGAQNGSTLQLAEFKLIGTPTFGTPDFTLPAAITTVEEEAFLSAGMSVVLVPDSCTSISDHAFKDCAALTQIHIPAACTLGTDVFDGCTLVYVFGTSGSPAETYCQEHENCVFVKE